MALDYVRSYIAEHGYPPTLREIGSHMGIRSTNGGVNDHLRALERKGYIRHDSLKARGLVLASATKDDEPVVAREIDRLRADNNALFRLLEQVRDALYRVPVLSAEGVIVLRDIRAVLRTRGR